MIPAIVRPVARDTDEIRAALSESDWGQNVAASHIEELISRFGVFMAPQGACICREGDAGDFIGLVISGRLRVSKSDDFGSERGLANLGPGMSFGEMAFVDGQCRSANVTAAEDSVVLLLSREDFDLLAEKRPALAVELLLQLIRHLSQRLRKTTERSVHRGY